MSRRRPSMHTVGPFFSTDAGGQTGSRHHIGATDANGIPPIQMPGLEDFLGTVSAMQVPSLGTFTPWGQLVRSGIGYSVIPIARTPQNLLIFELSAVATLLDSLGMAVPPYLGLLITTPAGFDEIERAVAGTPYGFAGSTTAVYSQADRTGIPAVRYIAWLRQRDPEDRDGGPGSLVAAGALDGVVVLAQMVPAEIGDRPLPDMSVTDAAAMQAPMFFVSTAPAAPNSFEPIMDVPNESEPSHDVTAASISYDIQKELVAVLTIAGVAGVLGFVLGRGRMRKR